MSTAHRRPTSSRLQAPSIRLDNKQRKEGGIQLTERQLELLQEKRKNADIKPKSSADRGPSIENLHTVTAPTTSWADSGTSDQSSGQFYGHGGQKLYDDTGASWHESRSHASASSAASMHDAFKGRLSSSIAQPKRSTKDVTNKTAVQSTSVDPHAHQRRLINTINSGEDSEKGSGSGSNKGRTAASKSAGVNASSKSSSASESSSSTFPDDQRAFLRKMMKSYSKVSGGSKSRKSTSKSQSAKEPSGYVKQPSTTTSKSSKMVWASRKSKGSIDPPSGKSTTSSSASQDKAVLKKVLARAKREKQSSNPRKHGEISSKSARMLKLISPRDASSKEKKKKAEAAMFASKTAAKLANEAAKPEQSRHVNTARAEESRPTENRSSLTNENLAKGTFTKQSGVGVIPSRRPLQTNQPFDRSDSQRFIRPNVRSRSPTRLRPISPTRTKPKSPVRSRWANHMSHADEVESLETKQQKPSFPAPSFRPKHVPSYAHTASAKPPSVVAAPMSKDEKAGYDQFLQVLKAEASGANSHLWDSFNALFDEEGNRRALESNVDKPEQSNLDRETKDVIASISTHLKRTSESQWVSGTQLAVASSTSSVETGGSFSNTLGVASSVSADTIGPDAQGVEFEVTLKQHQRRSTAGEVPQSNPILSKLQQVAPLTPQRFSSHSARSDNSFLSERNELSTPGGKLSAASSSLASTIASSSSSSFAASAASSSVSSSSTGSSAYATPLWKLGDTNSTASSCTPSQGRKFPVISAEARAASRKRRLEPTVSLDSEVSIPWSGIKLRSVVDRSTPEDEDRPIPTSWAKIKLRHVNGKVQDDSSDEGKSETSDSMQNSIDEPSEKSESPTSLSSSSQTSSASSSTASSESSLDRIEAMEPTETAIVPTGSTAIVPTGSTAIVPAGSTAIVPARSTAIARAGSTAIVPARPAAIMPIGDSHEQSVSSCREIVVYDDDDIDEANQEIIDLNTAAVKQCTAIVLRHSEEIIEVPKVIVGRNELMKIHSKPDSSEALLSWRLAREDVHSMTLDMDSYRVALVPTSAPTSQKLLSFSCSEDFVTFVNAFHVSPRPPSDSSTICESSTEGSEPTMADTDDRTNEKSEKTKKSDKNNSLQSDGDATIVESLSMDEQKVLEEYREKVRNGGLSALAEEAPAGAPSEINVGPTSPVSDISTALSVDESRVAEKYLKMLEDKVPKDDVSAVMSKDKVDPKIMGFILGYNSFAIPSDSSSTISHLSQQEQKIASLYQKMLKMMIPEDAVRHKMKRDGVDEKIAFAVLGQDKLDDGVAENVANKLSEAEQKIAETYKKMLKMMVPKEAVEHKMAKDQVDPKIVIFVVGDSGAAKKKDETLTPDEEKVASTYRQMLRMKIPEEAVRHRMTKERIPEKIVTAVLGNGAGSSSVSVASTQSKKKGKLGFHWNALSSDEALGKSIWGKKQKRRKTESVEKEKVVDISEHVELFQKKVETDKTVKIKAVAQAGPEKDMAKLIDLNRANNVAISLKAFKEFSYSELSDIIKYLDPLRKIQGDRALFLSDLLPSPPESKAILSYKGGNDRLVPAELWFKSVVPIKRVEEKTRILRTMETFSTEVTELTESFDLLTRVCQQVMSSDRILDVLEMVRQIGNRMNEGRGEAAGFKLDFLSRLAQTKGTDKKTTALDLLVIIFTARNQSDRLALSLDFPDCHDASRISLSDLNSNFNDLNGALNKCKTELKMLNVDSASRPKTKLGGRKGNGTISEPMASSGGRRASRILKPSSDIMGGSSGSLLKQANFLDELKIKSAGSKRSSSKPMNFLDELKTKSSTEDDGKSSSFLDEITTKSSGDHNKPSNFLDEIKMNSSKNDSKPSNFLDEIKMKSSGDNGGPSNFLDEIKMKSAGDDNKPSSFLDEIKMKKAAGDDKKPSNFLDEIKSKSEPGNGGSAPSVKDVLSAVKKSKVDRTDSAQSPRSGLLASIQSRSAGDLEKDATPADDNSGSAYTYHGGIKRICEFLQEADQLFSDLGSRREKAISSCKDLSEFFCEPGGEKAAATLLGILAEFTSNLDRAVKKFEDQREAEERKKATQRRKLAAQNTPGRTVRPTKSEGHLVGARNEKSLVFMVNEMLKTADDEIKRDFSQGIDVDNPDGKLKEIYAREQIRLKKAATKTGTSSELAVSEEPISELQLAMKKRADAAESATEVEKELVDESASPAIRSGKPPRPSQSGSQNRWVSEAKDDDATVGDISKSDSEILAANSSDSDEERRVNQRKLKRVSRWSRKVEAEDVVSEDVNEFNLAVQKPSVEAPKNMAAKTRQRYINRWSSSSPGSDPEPLSEAELALFDNYGSK